MNHFPSWRYHATLPPVIVQDPVEDEALGEGWAHTPAAFFTTELVTEPGSNEPQVDAEPKKRGRKKAA